MTKSIIPLALALLASPALGQWEYGKFEDKMRGTGAEYAELAAFDTVKSSTGKPIRLSLWIVRPAPTKLGVMLLVDGALTRCPQDDCKVSAKFDRGAVDDFLAVQNDETFEGLRIFDAMHFAGALKRASKLHVEIPLYREGRRQFVFAVQGLKWDVPDYPLKEFLGEAWGSPMSRFPLLRDVKTRASGEKCGVLDDAGMLIAKGLKATATLCFWDDQYHSAVVNTKSPDSSRRIRARFDKIYGKGMHIDGYSSWPSPDRNLDVNVTAGMIRGGDESWSFVVSHKPIGSLVPAAKK